MNARHSYRTTPIPFSNNALVFQTPSIGASIELIAAEPSHTPWGSAIAQLSQTPKPSTNTSRGRQVSTATAASAEATSPMKTARARYDGPHALSIRSATSGRHYRFEHRGAEQAIDTLDIALLRKIEGITIL